MVGTRYRSIMEEIQLRSLQSQPVLFPFVCFFKEQIALLVTKVKQSAYMPCATVPYLRWLGRWSVSFSSIGHQNSAGSLLDHDESGNTALLYNYEWLEEREGGCIRNIARKGSVILTSYPVLLLLLISGFDIIHSIQIVDCRGWQKLECNNLHPEL